MHWNEGVVSQRSCQCSVQDPLLEEMLNPQEEGRSTAVSPSDYPQRDLWPLTQATAYQGEGNTQIFLCLGHSLTADQKCHQWPPYHHTSHLMVIFLGPECKMHISMIS